MENEREEREGRGIPEAAKRLEDMPRKPSREERSELWSRVEKSDQQLDVEENDR
jgi:hypothetical protein